MDGGDSGVYCNLKWRGILIQKYAGRYGQRGVVGSSLYATHCRRWRGVEVVVEALDGIGLTR